MKAITTLVLSLFFSGISSATEVASKFVCATKSSPEHIVGMFVERKVVLKEPYAQVDSISYFAAKSGFTAFGYPLVAVAAFQEDSKAFSRAPGTSPGNRFALVIQASEWQLIQAAYKLGVKQMNERNESYPKLRIEGFNSQMQEPLPKGANPQFVYTQVLCLPKV